mgnify:CR=1 FL=1
MAEDTEKSAKAATIIRNHMLGSAASGLLPLPVLDVAILTGIQVRMASKLAELHDVKFSEQRARAVITALAGQSLAFTAGNLLGMLIPGLKALRNLGGLTIPPAVTYAVGRVLDKHFESGGTVWTFDPARARDDYEKEVKTGQQVVEQNFAGVKP